MLVQWLKNNAHCSLHCAPLFTALCIIVHCIVHAISVATSAINVAGGIYLGLLKLWVIEGVINWTLKKMENNEREKDMRRVWLHETKRGWVTKREEEMRRHTCWESRWRRCSSSHCVSTEGKLLSRWSHRIEKGSNTSVLLPKKKLIFKSSKVWTKKR